MPSKAEEQKERRHLAGSTSTLTYHRLAQIDLGLENQGRFAAADRRSNAPPSVVGSTPVPVYPRAAGPWTGGDPAGLEEPLGYDINALEPCGTAQEIETSIANAELATPSALLEVPSSASNVETGVAIPQIRAEIAALPLDETTLSGAATGGEPETGLSESASRSSLPCDLRGSPPTTPSTPVIKRRHGL